MMNFLSIELTSRCNKNCFCCGRRKMEREHPELCNWGNMPYEMVIGISRQAPQGCVIQFHNNGDPLLYPWLGSALQLFTHNIRCFNTNGKLLLEKADEIIGNLNMTLVEAWASEKRQFYINRHIEQRRNELPGCDRCHYYGVPRGE